MISLLLKLTLAPALVVGATLAARRYGDRVGGLVVGIPVVAGPVLLIVGLDHGAAYAAHAARFSLLGIVGGCTFCVIASHLARRGWPLALGAGWLGFLGVALALSQVGAPTLVGFVAALAAIGLGLRLMPAPPDVVVVKPPPPWWDLQARAAATAVLVLALTTAAGSLGSAISGALAPAPVAISIIVAFTLTQASADAAVRAIRGYCTALPGFAFFFVLVAALA